MTDRPDIDELVAKAVAAYNALPPVEKAIAQVEQKLSFVYGNLPLDSTTTKAELRAMMPEFVLAAEIYRLRAKAQRQAALIEKLTAALDAARFMLDRGPKPRKLDDALSWRENDERVRVMVEDALTAARDTEPTP